MTIKPKKSQLDAIIAKGSPDNTDKKPNPQWTAMSLRISVDLLNALDINVKDRIGLSRNAWILEAIQEKLKNERKD